MNFSNQFLFNVPSYYIPSENIRKPTISRFYYVFRKYIKGTLERYGFSSNQNSAI